MPAVTRQGDKNTGHDDCPPIDLATGSSNVFINGKSCGRKSDVYNPHSCPAHVPHSGTIVSGSSTVFVNGLPIARVSDKVDCPDTTVAEGSPNVSAN